MLPFSKRKNSDEVELDEDDLVPAESEPAPSPSVKAKASLPLPTLPPFRAAPARARTRTLTPRRILDEGIEEVVAGECLATIAPFTSIADPSSSSHVRAARRRPEVFPPPLPAGIGVRVPEEDALTAPRVQLPPDLPAGPPAAFVRRSSPALAPSAVSSSVAPVVAEPTIIVVRGRPRAVWVLGAAAMGALCAIAAGRLLPSLPAPEPVVVAAAPAPLPPPPTEVTAPPGPVALPPVVPKAKPPAIVTFADDQGVAIKAPPRPVAALAPVRPTAPAPVKSTAMLPDGTLTLGATAVSAPAARPTPSPPDPPKKPRTLTPEQQLAEAQLKASMR